MVRGRFGDGRRKIEANRRIKTRKYNSDGLRQWIHITENDGLVVVERRYATGRTPREAQSDCHPTDAGAGEQ